MKEQSAMKKEVFSARMPPETIATLKDLAERTGRPVSDIVRLILARASEADLPEEWFRLAHLQRIAAPLNKRSSK